MLLRLPFTKEILYYTFNPQFKELIVSLFEALFISYYSDTLNTSIEHEITVL